MKKIIVISVAALAMCGWAVGKPRANLPKDPLLAKLAAQDAALDRKYMKEGGLAFPGARGFGRAARGARASSSPTVYHVTNLDDSGKGSLRDAVSKPGRIVVFDVAGVIKIKSRISFASGLYIAGQTAPGDGVTVYGNGCSFSGANDIICRYLRWRMGKCGTKGKDCAGIANGRNMIFDHCSFSWGRDENFSINDNVSDKIGNITIQNGIISQGLLSHSAGGLVQANDITLYRNLYCDNVTRNNKLKGRSQYANNIVYNWRNACVILGGGSKGESHSNITGNLFVNGPAGGGEGLGGGNERFHFYGDDNWQDGDKDGKLDPHPVKTDGGGDRVFKPYPYPELPLYPAKRLVELTLATVGASLPRRDPADLCVINEVLSFGTRGEIISDEKSIPGGAPTKWNLREEGTGKREEERRKRKDTDGDGIPDWWEKANGTDKRNPHDAVAKAANGYLNIENYINSIR